MSEIGERLRRLRFDRRVKLRQVESATGVSNAYLSQLESGKVANPSLVVLGKLADYYGVSVGRLATGDDEPTAEAVDHPPHYNAGGVEVIDAIEAWGLGFGLGNAVKYIARAGKKDPARTIEDLRKAAWYLNREIERREKLAGKADE